MGKTVDTIFYINETVFIIWNGVIHTEKIRQISIELDLGFTEPYYFFTATLEDHKVSFVKSDIGKMVFRTLEGAQAALGRTEK